MGTTEYGKGASAVYSNQRREGVENHVQDYHEETWQTERFRISFSSFLFFLCDMRCKFWCLFLWIFISFCFWFLLCYFSPGYGTSLVVDSEWCECDLEINTIQEQFQEFGSGSWTQISKSANNCLVISLAPSHRIVAFYHSYWHNAFHNPSLATNEKILRCRISFTKRKLRLTFQSRTIFTNIRKRS